MKLTGTVPLLKLTGTVPLETYGTVPLWRHSDTLSWGLSPAKRYYHRGQSPASLGTCITRDSPLFQMRHGYCAGGLYGGCGVLACHAAGHGASTWTIWRFPHVEVRLERALRHAWTMRSRRSMPRMPHHLRVFEWRAGQSPSVSRRMRATSVRRRALAAPPMPAPSTAWPNARRATESLEAAPSACGARTRPSL